jgi:hypothetical protein
VDPRVAALDRWWQNVSLERLAASIGHVIKIFTGDRCMGGTRLSGSEFGLAQSSASEGNPKFLDQSMVAISIISSMEASARSFFVGIDSSLLVRATLGETLDPGLLDQMMAAYGNILPYVGIVFGVDAGGRGSEAEQCASSFGDVESRRHVAAGPWCWMYIGLTP